MSESAQNPLDSATPEQKQQFLFMMLVQQHQQIAMVGLGEEENPATQQKEKDRSSAQYAIDTLEMLEAMTDGNRTKEMSDYLTSVLSQLRLKFASTTF